MYTLQYGVDAVPMQLVYDSMGGCRSFLPHSEHLSTLFFGQQLSSKGFQRSNPRKMHGALKPGPVLVTGMVVESIPEASIFPEQGSNTDKIRSQQTDLDLCQYHVGFTIVLEIEAGK